VPRGFKRTKLRAIEADTQLNPQVAATVAVQLRSNRDVVAANAFSGSQENVAGGPILRRGGLAFVSGSATRASLTDPSTTDGGVLKNGFFRRVVPNDNFQARTDVTFLRQKVGVGSGDTVMTVDSAEAYSVPLITLARDCSRGERQGRPAVAARDADRLHGARQQGGRQKAKVVCSARRSPRTPSCSSSS
jgi:ABC-type branched-subunit amino acid transport system substrate-binding protein